MLHASIALKAVVIGTVVGLASLAGFTVWWQSAKNQQSSTKLTERSQQFLAEHGSDVATQEIEFGDQQEYELDYAYDTACFSVTMPFKSKPARVEEQADSCILRLLTAAPISRVAIQVKPKQSELSDDPAITMRRSNLKEYQEQSIESAKYGQVLRFEGQEAVTLFWQTAGKTITIGFTGLTDPATVDTERLASMIESFQLVSSPSAMRTYETTHDKPASQSGF